MSDLFVRSLESKQPVEIIYINESGQLTQRTITIISVSEHVIKAYCHYRKGLRTFKQANILSALPYKKRSRTKRAI